MYDNVLKAASISDRIIGRMEKSYQIPEAFEQLKHRINSIAEATALLEDRLDPVVDRNGMNHTTKAGMDPRVPVPLAPVCPMAASIREMVDNLEMNLARLQNLHNNIQF